jgi:hypothetical protein
MKNKLFILMIIFLNVTSSAYAEEPVTAAASSSGFGNEALASFKKYFDTPAGVAVIAGIATVYSTTLYKAASQQESDSKENIKKIDKIIASFKDSYAEYCPKGRDDLTVPSCYCYLNTGKKNTDRSNSKTCTDLWAKTDYLITGASTGYTTGTTADIAGCVAIDGQFDATCKCKKMIDSAGKNACKKSTSITLPNDNFSTAFAVGTGIDSLLKYSANSTNGNPRYDLISSGTLTANAIKTQKLTDQLITKLPKGTNFPKINEENVDKFAGALLGSKNIQAAMASTGGGSAMNIGASRSNNPAAENLLKQAQAKVGLDITGGKGLGTGAKAEQKKSGLNFNFADVGAPAGGQVLQDFPEENKNYKYKNSDIGTDKGASIFEIISNRYIQSGLKRLFEE